MVVGKCAQLLGLSQRAVMFRHPRIVVPHFGREDAKGSDGVILLRQVAATFCSIQSIRHDTSLKEKTDAPQENHAPGDPGLGGCVGWGPGIRPDGWCVPPQGYID
jgi:hypothetical protein